MQIETRDGSQERHILCSLVLNDHVLGRIAPHFTGNELSTKWGNIVASWCVNHWKKYSKAPRTTINSIYRKWRLKDHGEETNKLMEMALEAISEEAENSSADYTNSDYLIDQTIDYFNFVKAQKHRQEVEAALDQGNTQEALSYIANFRPVELSEQAGSDLFLDEAEVRDTFETSMLDPLVMYGGPLGRFLNPFLVRDAFVAFVGPEKSCKSFFLQDLAYRAMTQRNRVAYFEVGDMSRRQVKRRLLVRASGHPIHADRWPHTIKYPVRITRGDEIARVESKELTFNKPLNADKAWQSCLKVMSQTVKSKRSFFRLSVHPNSSINVDGIRSILDGWIKEGWIPDVVVIDYLDILAPPAGRMDRREAIDLTWKQLRSLTTELHVLVAGATQANADSYTRKTIDRRNFSESKTKNAHVTGLFGLNQTTEEKEEGTIRVNIMEGRDREFSPRRCVHVASCLALGNPAVVSGYWEERS